jgi:hypothetical protein
MDSVKLSIGAIECDREDDEKDSNQREVRFGFWAVKFHQGSSACDDQIRFRSLESSVYLALW